MASKISQTPFITLLSETHTDAVSGKLMKRAVTLLPCGHTLNKDTVKGCLEQNRPCPLDQSRIQRYVPNYTARHMAETNSEYPIEEPPTEAAQTYLQKGKDLVGAGDLEGALQAFLQALKISPTYVEAQTCLAYCLIRLSRQPRAPAGPSGVSGTRSPCDASVEAPSPPAQPFPNRNVEFVENTAKGMIRGEVLFGAAEWKEYFGEVGEVPPLPHNFHEINKAPCPFSNDPLILVEHTHMWVLVPRSVNGRPLTLNSLKELIRDPLSGNRSTDYQHYAISVRDGLGDIANAAPYWALMTRGLVPGTQRKSHADQKAIIGRYAGYTHPDALTAAVCLSVEYLTSGTFLLPKTPFTFTRCQETLNNGEWSVFVGAFGPPGFIVNVNFDDYYGGAVALRKFL